MALLLLDDAGSTTHLIWRGQELNWGRLSTLDSTSFLGGSIRFMAVDAHIGGIGNSTNTVTALFNGTSIGFYGLPFAADGTSMEAIVDGQSVTFIPGSNDYFGPVYQSPTLSDGLHNVTLVQGLELDFMVVTPGTTTSLTGELMILDDGDQTMTYTGSWTKNSSILASDKSRAPFGGDFHQTTNSLDSATLKFTGIICVIIINLLVEF
ncbi:hypothetical protein H0H87_008170 [Tephrocybe sp. NHM501043]|nr:hypothetical protein H0H87_008170 [Tephrocybe sp. NHM501043]